VVRFAGAQRSKEQREGVFASRDRKSRQGDAGEFPKGGLGCRKAFCIGCRKVHHDTNNRHWLETNASDAEPAHLDQPGKGLRRAHKCPPMRGFDVHAVVAYEPRERQRTGLPGLNQRERKPRFA
jgi:hypothetical protein